MGQACQNMIMGHTLSIYTKRTFLMDGINSDNSKTLFAMSHINNLSIMLGRVLLGKTITKLGLMCLAQGTTL